MQLMTKAIDLITGSFSTEQCNSYSLSIREFPNGFSFCVVDLENEIAVAIKHITHNSFREILKQEPLLQLPYAHINYMADAVFSFIPKQFSDRNILKQFLPLDSFQQNRAIINTNLTAYDNICLFDSKKFNSISQNQHNMHPLVPLCKLLYKEKQKDCMMAEIAYNKLNVALMIDGKLELVNAFPIDTFEDVAYYILAIYQQKNLSQETLPTRLCGQLNQELNPIELLKKYIKEIDIITPDNLWPRDFESSLYLHFATLTQASLCVS